MTSLGTLKITPISAKELSDRILHVRCTTIACGGEISEQKKGELCKRQSGQLLLTRVYGVLVDLDLPPYLHFPELAIQGFVQGRTGQTKRGYLQHILRVAVWR